MIEAILALIIIHSPTTTLNLYPTKPITALEAPFTPTVHTEEPIIKPEQVASSTKEIILAKISWCESRNDPKAKNASSSASGKFQFIRSSWEHYGKQLWGGDWVNKDVFNEKDNEELAGYVYDKNGTVDWLASAECWSKI